VSVVEAVETRSEYDQPWYQDTRFLLADRNPNASAGREALTLHVIAGIFETELCFPTLTIE
jgi:hypothetical protein